METVATQVLGLPYRGGGVLSQSHCTLGTAVQSLLQLQSQPQSHSTYAATATFDTVTVTVAITAIVTVIINAISVIGTARLSWDCCSHGHGRTHKQS